MVFATAITVCADTFDIDFSTLGWTDATKDPEIPTTGSPLTITAEQATSSTVPTYYTAGGLRVYKNGLINFSIEEGYEITKIVFTTAGNTYAVSGSAVDKSGSEIGILSVSGAVTTWTGNSDYVQIKDSGVSKHSRIGKISVTYEYVAVSTVEPVEIKYTLNKADGIVTLSCATEGAKIYYGFSADQMVNEYTEPFTVKENCTVYAYAEKGDDKSITKSAYIDLPYTSFKKVLDNSELTDNIVIVGDFEVIYQNVDKGRLILTDGTSNILIYRNSSDYSIDYPVGTKISKIEGVRAAYNSCFRLIDAELTEGGNGAEYTPIELSTFEGLSYDDNLFDEVVIKGCNISGKDLGSPVIELGDETVALYDVFGVGYENISGCDVTGFVWRYKDVLEIVPISIQGGEVTATVETPVITPNKRELSIGEEVTITCPTEGVVIYYTLDGTEPTQESEKYTAPIPFKESCTIKARAFYEGEDKTMFPSAIASRDYHVIDPTCNVISEGNHDVDEKNSLNSYKKHTCIVDGVEYHMNAAHLGEGGNGNDGSASSLMLNNNSSRFCYVIQVGENEGYVLDKIELAYNNDAKTVFAVRGSNTPFDDSAEGWADYKDAITSHGTLIGNITKDSQSIEFAKDYKYFALYPTVNGAVYLDNITIRYREPAPLTAPELKGFDDYENVIVEYDEDEEAYMVMSDEALTLYFDEEDLDNPDVQIMYMIMGGDQSDAAGGDDDNMGMGVEPQTYDTEKGIVISSSCELIYSAINIVTDEQSEPIRYSFMIEIPEPKPFVAPALKGLDDAKVEGNDETGYMVESDHALSLTFDYDPTDPSIMVVYYMMTEEEYMNEEEAEPAIYDGTPINIDDNYVFSYFALDPTSGTSLVDMKRTEPINYMFVINLPTVAPAAPELVGEGYRIDGDYMLSENVVKINFKVAEGTHIYYQVSDAKESVKTRACEDEHAGFTKHEGEDIELSHMHKTFTYFACDPATGLHSEPVTLNLTVATGISEIDAENADVLYFDLNGLRVINPEKGTYIRVQKGKAEKVVK